MQIDAVDFFYLSMPVVTTDADGSQDALLVRVVADGAVGWGECEASPLTSIAAFVAPMSHGACRPVGASVVGQKLDGPNDIRRIALDVARNSMDLLQAAHTFSGVEIALWDLLGKVRDEPVWRLLGFRSSEPKIPYASLLFGETPQETLDRGNAAVARGFRALKFGWAGFGEGSVARDAEQLVAAREALGSDGHLFVDAGQIWREDVDAAALRTADLERVDAGWLEEPFEADAYHAYSLLGQRTKVPLAGGEGAHNVHMASQSHRLRQRGIRAGGLRPHRRDRCRRPRRSLRGRARGDIREPHLHVTPRALGLPAAVRRIGEPPDL